MGRPKGSKNKRVSSLKGKTYEELYGIEEGQKRRNTCKLTHKPGYSKGEKMPLDVKLRMKASGRMGGLRRGTGRGKKGWYKGIWCDSSWELAFVIWHIDNEIPIRRNKEFFTYRFNGEEHKYYPDFLVGDTEQLYEIKAYLDEKAKIKLDSCPKPIILVTYGQIEKYLEYVKQKAGCEDFTTLYERVSSAGCGGVSDTHV